MSHSVDVSYQDIQPVAVMKPLMCDVAMQTASVTNELPFICFGEQVSHNEIARRAYLRAEQRGFTPSYENEDWLTAESDLVDFWFTQQRHNANA